MGRLWRTAAIAFGLTCAVPALLGAQQPASRDAATVARELEVAQGAARIPLLVEAAALRSDEPASAIRLAEEALALLARHPSGPDEVKARNLRSNALQVQGAYADALAEARRAVDVAQRGHVDALLGDAQYQVALAQWRLGEYAKALATAEGARALQARRGNTAALADTLRLIGGIHQSMGDLDAGLASAIAALQVSEAVGDQRAIGRSHNNIGLIYWDLHRYDDALAALRRALAIHERVGSRTSLANTLNNLGLVLGEMKRPHEALPYFERSLALDREAGNRAGEAACLNNLGWIYQDLKLPDRARPYHQQALSIREQIGDQEGVVRARGALGELALSQGDAQTAIRLLEQSIALAKKIDDRLDQAAYLEVLARAKESAGDVAGAYQAFRQFHETQKALSEQALRDRTAELEARYRVQEQQRELVTANHAAADSRRMLYWTAGGTVLLASALLLLGFLYVQRGLAQRALAESEQRYRSVFQASVVPTFLVDPARLAVVDRNAHANAMAPVEFEGAAPIADLEPGWVRHALSRLADLATDDQVDFEEAWTDTDGRERWYELRGNAVGLGGRRHWLVTLRDTTAVHEAAAAQLREDKMRSLGLLAGGIAHHFNNALTAVIGYVALARDAEAEERTETLDLAEQAALGASRLTVQLLAFAKGGQPLRRSLDLGVLLRDAVSLAGAGSRMKIDVETPSGLWPALVDAGQCSQVVSNLVINAQQATGEAGRLLVRAANVVEGDPIPGTVVPQGRYVRVDFVDNGPGIPAAIRDRIFEPYFTTRKDGHGLGLATAYAICRNHDGALTCTSVEGQGATFSAFFPAADDAPPVAPEAVAVAPSRGEGRILVLEDEPLVRNVVQRVLVQRGYDVETVAEGQQAVSRYVDAFRGGRRFDLLIMDLTIPGGMGGRQALAEILRCDPEARAIVASGYSDDPTMANYEAAGFVGALPKPFQSGQLGRIVSDVLKTSRRQG
jgi:signal transduction histidine kinase/CheY-like chemotaxis protein